MVQFGQLVGEKVLDVGAGGFSGVTEAKNFAYLGQGEACGPSAAVPWPQGPSSGVLGGQARVSETAV